ncbi:hypothetical protein [Pukyongiella litopenaei]|uniref:Uncharacterized protein n=1 Tax=Pukyongiella litopenaei TaxID=2605946 RepID=A0A2S0MKQ9_9RHOB|nr:hypothetical protein [Pukyongiella litopenaei]AVO36474.1 hypothetical protein C6Y53_01295 [Pukyongiella litopenaei]
MKKIAVLLTLGLTAGAVQVSAHGDTHSGGVTYLENAPMTYELFETAIEHVDLDTCPGEFDGDASFCRMTLASDMAHIFVFSHDGDQPLLAVKTVPVNEVLGF